MSERSLKLRIKDFTPVEGGCALFILNVSTGGLPVPIAERCGCLPESDGRCPMAAIHLPPLLQTAVLDCLTEDL